MLTVQRRELLVFLFLIIPSMILSFFIVRTGALGFVATAAATILRDLSLVSLIAFFLWRNSESLEQIGWTSKFAVREALLGVALFLPFALVIGGLVRLFVAAGLKIPSTELPNFLTPQGPAQLALAVVLVGVVAVCEELIFRGYLILRFTQVTHSRTAGVLLSTALFSLGHGYEGTAGVATVGMMGIAFALIYQWRRSLIAPMVMHFAQDFIAILVIPRHLHH